MLGFLIWSVLFNSESYIIREKSNITLRHQMLTRPVRPEKIKKETFSLFFYIIILSTITPDSNSKSIPARSL